MATTIKTNHQFRPIESRESGALFIRAYGEEHDLADFMRVSPSQSLKGWDGYRGDTAFSGLVIKICKESGDAVKVGRVFC